VPVTHDLAATVYIHCSIPFSIPLYSGPGLDTCGRNGEATHNVNYTVWQQLR